MMQPHEVKAARRALHMTQAQLAAALKLKPPHGARRVRAWESEGADHIPISGPAEVALKLLLEKGARGERN